MNLKQIQNKFSQLENPEEENRKRITNHKNCSMHFQLAAKYHLLAAANHEEGNHTKGFENTYKAQLQSASAEECLREFLLFQGKVYQSFLLGKQRNK